MPVSPARAAAFDILLQVLQEDAYASELLHSARHQKLSAADHGLTTEIVMGVLRWRSALDTELARFSSQNLARLDPEVLTALRIGAFQLMRLDRVPARSAVNESVELVKRARKKSATAFVNALLRKVGADPKRIASSRDTTDTEQAVASLADTYAHPRWMIERWCSAYGPEKTLQLLRFDQQIPGTAVRLSNPEDELALRKNGIVLCPGALLQCARRIESGDVIHTEPFRAGRVAIQDEASQLIALLAGRGQQMLDCCAAPGGKTGLIAERNPQSSITALELHPHRARLLRQRVSATNVAVVAGDIRHRPLSISYNVVLADVPCSGTGTLQRHPEIKWRLKLEDLSDLRSRQIAILRSAMSYVAPKGRVIYSTCSLEPEENQEVIDQGLASDNSFTIRDCREELEKLRRGGELVWPNLENLIEGPFLRTLPGVQPCDGFFAAILEKK